jgi:CHC2 zinc finger
MFKPILTPRDIAERFNRFLPEEIRSYLKGRGIPATIINCRLLGWDGKRITIPIFGESTREVIGFRYAKPPALLFGEPEMESDGNVTPELYGWETLARTPHRVVICEGEFDRLVLEARGYPAAASTAGADTFLPEWAEHFDDITDVFICFNRSIGSDAAAKKVQELLPQARIARLPADVGEGGTISDYFVALERTQRDFEILLASAPGVTDTGEKPVAIPAFQPKDKSQRKRADRVRKAVPLHAVVFEFTNMQASDGKLVGHCPFHDDHSRSFSVYPETGTYRCSICHAEGDVVKFLMDKESMTFGQALEVLEAFEFTHELYGS